LEQEVETLLANRQALDAQCDDEEQPRICICGFRGKQEIMPKVRKLHGLSKADPPKRIFAETTSDRFGGIALAFPYSDYRDMSASCDAIIASSAQRASRHREVVLSHHLAEVQDLLSQPADAACGSPWPGGHKKWRKAAESASSHLQDIADWLLKGAYAVDAKTGDAVVDIDPAFLRLKVLERLVDMWASPRVQNSPGSNMMELRKDLHARGLNVVVAFLDIGEAQALRDEVAEVRRSLCLREPFARATFRDIEHALEACDGDSDRAVDMLLNDPAVKQRIDLLRIREQFWEKNPRKYINCNDILRALAEEKERVYQDRTQSNAEMDEANRMKSQASAAAEVKRRSINILRKATAEGPLDEMMQAEMLVREKTFIAETAEASAKAAESEAARRLAAAEAASRHECMLSSAVDRLLLKYPVVGSKKKEHYTWEETLAMSATVHRISFEVKAMGWTSIDASEELVPPESVRLPPCRQVVEEFYPAPVLPQCPARSSSMVVGRLEDVADVAEVFSCGTDHRSSSFTDEVQPDGTFSVVCAANSTATLRTMKWDGSSSSDLRAFFGPSCGKVTSMGDLSPSEKDHMTEFAEIEVVLPRLDVPPCVSPESSEESSLGGWKEKCTCTMGKEEAQRATFTTTRSARKSRGSIGTSRISSMP
jgi:hypothetical protein